MIWRLLNLLCLLPSLLLATWVCSRTLISTADWLKVLRRGKVSLAVRHGHAGISRAILVEGIGVCRRCEGKGAIASSLAGGIQDVLVAAGDLAAELNTSGKNRRRLVGEDGSRQALGAAQPTGLYRRLALQRRAKGRTYRGAALGAIGRHWGDLWNLCQGAAKSQQGK